MSCKQNCGFYVLQEHKIHATYNDLYNQLQSLELGDHQYQYNGNNLCNNDTYTQHYEPARVAQRPVDKVLKIFISIGQYVSVIVSQCFDVRDGSDGPGSGTNKDQCNNLYRRSNKSASNVSSQRSW